jgi:A/G-specific adenine glycosylase
LDGNVIRVLTRIHGIATDPRGKQTNTRLWQLAEELVTEAAARPACSSQFAPRASHLNQSLMELGALICTPRSPDCPVCPVRKHCVAFRQNRQDELPNLGQRAKTTERRFIAFVIQRNGKFLARQRPAGGVNGHLWEFPNVEVGARVSNPQRAATNDLQLDPATTEPFCIIKHSITRYRITLEAWLARPATTLNKIPGRWLTPNQLHRLAFTSAHKKILARIRTS